MHSHKGHKIDLALDYPCPRRCRGRLMPIILTEAFGCNCCQQIFVVDQSGYVIEQLLTTEPYKQAWRWTGREWNKASVGLRDGYLPFALVIMGILLTIWLPQALTFGGSNIIPWAVVALLSVLSLAFWNWLAYRR